MYNLKCRWGTVLSVFTFAQRSKAKTHGIPIPMNSNALAVFSTIKIRSF